MENVLEKATNKQPEKNEYRLEEMVKTRTAELTRALLQLEEARNAAESANRARSAFLANISHELRTPLNAILGYAQILQLEEPTSALLKKGLQTIQISGEHLSRIINDILDLTRLETEKNYLQQNDLHLPLLLKTLGKTMSIYAEEKNITFSIQPFDFSQNCPAEGLPTALCGDEKRLRQTLINLLGNAIKFTNKGGVTLKVGPANSKETSGNGKGKKIPPLFRFQIEDTSSGADSPGVEKNLPPFLPAKNFGYKTMETGQELKISRKFIEAMGGQLQIKNTPGQGRVFWFDIPLLQISNQERNAVNSSNGDQSKRQGVPNDDFFTTY